MTLIVAATPQRRLIRWLPRVCYDAPVTFTRRTKAIIAAVLSVGWLLYMIVGLVSGIFVAGFVMWAASD